MARLGGMRKKALVAEARVRQRDEEVAPPFAEVRAGRGHEGFAAEEEAGLHFVIGDAMRPAGAQGCRHVGLLHEAVAGDHRIEALAQPLDLDPLGLRHARHVHGVDLQHDHPLMQDLVVLEVVQERRRRRGGVGGQEHRRAGNAVGRAFHALEELAERQGAVGHLAAHQVAAAAPRRDGGASSKCRSAWKRRVGFA